MQMEKHAEHEQVMLLLWTDCIWPMSAFVLCFALGVFLFDEFE